VSVCVCVCVLFYIEIDDNGDGICMFCGQVACVSY